jgi:acyl-CoA reductase-like NAD-dependent aldehyde dehydrogenase
MTSAADILLDDYPVSAATTERLRTGFFGHVIDGEVVASASGETFPIYDPSNGEHIADAALAGPEDVERAVASARRAFDDGRWRTMAPLDQERVLRRLAQLIGEHATELGELDVIDSGLLVGYAGFISQFAIDGVDYYSGWPSKIHGTIPAVPTDVAVYAIREPLGVIGLIMPWNGPSAVVVMVAAALAAGNSVILKPAEQTPMTAMRLGQLAAEAGLPPGVFNVLQGTGAVAGAGLVDHRDVDKISFTGSVDTGRRISTAAAARVKRVTMELGGKSAHIVFADADVEQAAAATAGAVWNNSGQVCTAGTRVLVQRSVYDDVVARMVESSRGVRVGRAFDPDTTMGPLISGTQLERVAGYVDIGREEGAEVALGGGRIDQPGYFYEPTIFTGVDNSMRIAQEEIFGPVMAVIPFDDEEDAYRIANDTEFGLAAGVWTNDLSRAHRAYRAIHTGTVWINCYQLVNAAVPYGGVKQSGHGRTLGAEMLDAFLVTKSVWMKVG